VNDDTSDGDLDSDGKLEQAIPDCADLGSGAVAVTGLHLDFLHQHGKRSFQDRVSGRIGLM